MKKHFPLIVAILTAILLVCFTVIVEAQPKPLHNGRYTYKQLVKRGYNPEKFKGRIFVTYKVYQQLLATTKSK